MFHVKVLVGEEMMRGATSTSMANALAAARRIAGPMDKVVEADADDGFKGYIVVRRNAGE